MSEVDKYRPKNGKVKKKKIAGKGKDVKKESMRKEIFLIKYVNVRGDIHPYASG